MTTAREIMTKDAQCVGEHESLMDAARKMRDLDVGALPICGDDDRLKGVITDRDITIRAVAEGKSMDTQVAELAQGKPVTIGADDSIEEALSVMSKNQVRRLPVIDGHKLVGIISQADIALKLEQDQTGKLVEAISIETGEPATR